MAYVVTEPCIGTKDRSCVEVCPVDCFYNFSSPELNDKVGKPSSSGDVGMLVIHPDECIHCGACEPECPVEAIYEDDDVPDKWSEYVSLNSRISEGFSPEELDKNRVTAK
ncbi:MAG TPA: ferredoxin family protein [Oligoflexia bacterium]|nr:ferredoxin family protein [Oligoflexia bacterium]HMP49325.1 ferredoxin family protein [Oligoflexia bacterium]